MATFVICHGTWEGGWCWREVRRRLERLGHEVYTPTLTGLGERCHLNGAHVDFNTHVEDVVNVIKFEDLSQVILVGHSYGGAVITGVAEQIPERVSHLVYLDALVPVDGKTVGDLFGAEVFAQTAEFVELFGDGWRLPYPGEVADGRIQDHPWHTYTQPIRMTNSQAAALPRTFINCTRRDTGAVYHDAIEASASRARALGWNYIEFAADHNPHLSMPEETAALLARIS